MKQGLCFASKDEGIWIEGSSIYYYTEGRNRDIIPPALEKKHNKEIIEKIQAMVGRAFLCEEI